MLVLMLIAMLVVTLALGRREPRAAAILDLIVASLLFLFRLVPGGAEWYVWGFSGLFVAISGLLLFAWKEIYA
ncbi:MAG: hypothetical protein ABIK65_07735 [Candidatus Eisenbacteria bacterium]